MEIRRLLDIVFDGLHRRAGTVYLVLTFNPTLDSAADWNFLLSAVPWIEDLTRGRKRLFQDLRSHGLGVVICADTAEALQRKSEVRDGRVVCRVVQARGTGRFRSRGKAPAAATGGPGPTNPEQAAPRVRRLDPAAEAGTVWADIG